MVSGEWEVGSGEWEVVSGKWLEAEGKAEGGEKAVRQLGKAKVEAQVERGKVRG